MLAEAGLPVLFDATDPIPVPPRYTSADFAKNHYWQARGRLDVPKERLMPLVPGLAELQPWVAQ